MVEVECVLLMEEKSMAGYKRKTLEAKCVFVFGNGLSWIKEGRNGWLGHQCVLMLVHLTNAYQPFANFEERAGSERTNERKKAVLKMEAIKWRERSVLLKYSAIWCFFFKYRISGNFARHCSALLGVVRHCSALLGIARHCSALLSIA